jgi:hypothetical protein
VAPDFTCTQRRGVTPFAMTIATSQCAGPDGNRLRAECEGGTDRLWPVTSRVCRRVARIAAVPKRRNWAPFVVCCGATACRLLGVKRRFGSGCGQANARRDQNNRSLVRLDKTAIWRGRRAEPPVCPSAPTSNLTQRNGLRPLRAKVVLNTLPPA